MEEKVGSGCNGKKNGSRRGGGKDATGRKIEVGG